MLVLPKDQPAGQTVSSPGARRGGGHGCPAGASKPWPRAMSWAACALLAVATLAAYANTLGSPFLFDDEVNILESASIRHLWPVWDVFLKSSAQRVPVRSRPVVNLSLAVNYATGGLNPLHYHLTNIAVHVLAGLVLFGLVRGTLSLPSVRERYGAEATPLAFVIAAAWMLHPLQTQAITYVIQRCEAMMGLFFLWALYCVLLSEGSRHPRWWRAAAVAACLASMGCKEVAVAAPLVILLYDRAFLAGSFREAWRRRRGMYLGLGATWIGLGVLLSWSGGPASMLGRDAGFSSPMASVEHARSQFGVILHYLRLSFWPYPQVFDYAWPTARTAGEIVPAALVVMGLLAATVWACVRCPKWGFLGAAFFLILAPTSSVMPIVDLAAEHRMYLPLAAVAVAAILAGYEVLKRAMAHWQVSLAGQRSIQVVIALTLLTSLGVAAFARNRVYESEWSVWNDTVQKAPHNGRAHANLGWALVCQGKPEEAIAPCQLAVKLAPGYADAHCNLGGALQSLGRVGEAVDCYRKAVEIDPRHAKSLYNLAVALAQQGKGDEAIPLFLKALKITPDDADCHYNLGRVLFSQGRRSEAIHHFETALGINPRDADCHCSLANALLAQGESDAALSHCRQAVSIDPSSAKYRQQLGRSFYLRGQGPEAILEWREALRLQPNEIALLNLLAWELATCPNPAVRNGSDAIAFAQRACQLAGVPSAELLDTLAAALAETGRFTDAARTASEALALASQGGDRELAAALRARIKLYEARSPFRDPRSPIGRPGR